MIIILSFLYSEIVAAYRYNAIYYDIYSDLYLLVGTTLISINVFDKNKIKAFFSILLFLVIMVNYKQFSQPIKSDASAALCAKNDKGKSFFINTHKQISIMQIHRYCNY